MPNTTITATTAAIDYNALTTADLRAACKARGLKVSARAHHGAPCNWLSRAALIAQLQGAPATSAPTGAPAASKPAAAPAPAPEPASAPASDDIKTPETVSDTHDTPPPKSAEKNATPDEIQLAHDWRMFLSEFGNARPEARFLNTIANKRKADDVKEYTINYFRLSANSFATDIAAKCESSEAQELFERTAQLDVGTKINTRLDVFFGEPGGGKTTAAIAASPDAEVVACNASMMPEDLFRGFTFVDGKPAYRGCALRRAMENGRTVILDEINLLSHECLRALQIVTDNKSKVTIGGEEIQIKSGFRVIGTMNLTIGEDTFGLPAPLVDRAREIKEFTLSDDRLAAIAFA